MNLMKRELKATAHGGSSSTSLPWISWRENWKTASRMLLALASIHWISWRENWKTNSMTCWPPGPAIESHEERIESHNRAEGLWEVNAPQNLMKRELKAVCTPVSHCGAVAVANLMKRELKGPIQFEVVRLLSRESHEERIESSLQRCSFSLPSFHESHEERIESSKHCFCDFLSLSFRISWRENWKLHYLLCKL